MCQISKKSVQLSQLTKSVNKKGKWQQLHTVFACTTIQIMEIYQIKNVI
jgi:hypothetical protein